MILGLLLAAQTATLWQIGALDGRPDGFALAPSSYAQYRNDPTYIAGVTATDAWSYVLPGPADPWAGMRAHRGTVFFNLQGKLAACRFVADLVDTHRLQPPRVSLWINGKRVSAWQAPAGNGDESVQGHPEKGRHSTWATAIPAARLRIGVNELQIRTDEGSWLLFDSLRLEGPASLHAAAVPPGLWAEPLEQEQVVLRTPQGPKQPVKLAVTNFGKAGRLEVTGDARWSGDLQTGTQTIELVASPPAKHKRISLRLDLGESSRAAAVDLEPVRPWTVYLLPHSHVDIGYTDYQPVVAAMHRRNFFDALSVVKESASFPSDARYRFNCEATWALDNLLHDGSPADLRAVAQAFRQRSFDCSANYCNTLTGLMRPEEMVRGYGFSTRLQGWLGVDLTTATQTDVPGVTWGAVGAMSQAGIKNLVLMPNPSDRIGGVLREWQDKPFFWVSPSGKEKILVWETASYGVAHGLRHFNGDRTKMFRTADPTQNFIEGYVFDRLRKLASDGYPYDCIAFPWSGTDNFPIDADVPYAARHWNEAYVTPRVVVSTVTYACETLKRRYGTKIPVVRGDLTPYWEDGAGSSARETAMNRASADRLVQAETLTAMRHPSAYDAARFWKAWSDVLLYSEHTWGAYNSVTEPDSEFARKQWAYKQGFAVDADRLSRELLARASAGRSLSVVNTSSWARSDLVLLPAARSRGGDRVLDARGRPLPSQRLHSGELAVLVEDVPAFGSVAISVVSGKPFSRASAFAKPGLLQSPEWRIELDPKTGGIAKLQSVLLGRGFAKASDPHRVNQFLYLPGGYMKDLQASRDPQFQAIESGPLVARVRVKSSAPGARTLTQDIQLVAGLDRVDLTNVVDKVAVRSKEAVHFAFPLNVPSGQVRIQGPWAVIRPDVDQMPGANKNWFTTQYFADVSNDRYGITWSSLDAPLLEVGGITATMLDGGFDDRQWIQHIGPTQTIYSWALNNHWYTNYKADQEGLLTFRYSLRAHGPYSADEAYRFGAGLAQPLVVSSAAPGQPLLTVSDPHVVVTALKPSEDGKALIARLWCVGNKPSLARLRWRSGIGAMSLSDSSERPLRPLSGTVRIAGWQIVTVRAELGSRQVAPASSR